MDACNHFRILGPIDGVLLGSTMALATSYIVFLRATRPHFAVRRLHNSRRSKRSAWVWMDPH